MQVISLKLSISRDFKVHLYIFQVLFPQGANTNSLVQYFSLGYFCQACSVQEGENCGFYCCRDSIIGLKCGLVF